LQLPHAPCAAIHAIWSGGADAVFGAGKTID
jgi:hypothetical protein